MFADINVFLSICHYSCSKIRGGYSYKMPMILLLNLESFIFKYVVKISNAQSNCIDSSSLESSAIDTIPDYGYQSCDINFEFFIIRCICVLIFTTFSFVVSCPFQFKIRPVSHNVAYKTWKIFHRTQRHL